jgi:hypothetical protein
MAERLNKTSGISACCHLILRSSQFLFVSTRLPLYIHRESDDIDRAQVTVRVDRVGSRAGRRTSRLVQ